MPVPSGVAAVTSKGTKGEYIITFSSEFPAQETPVGGHRGKNPDYNALCQRFLDAKQSDILEELQEDFLQFPSGTSVYSVIDRFLEYSGMTYDELMTGVNAEVYKNFEPVSCEEMKPEDIVYLDNFQHVLKRYADPKISGPYRVINQKLRMNETKWKTEWHWEPKKTWTLKQFIPGPHEPMLKKKEQA